VGGVCGRNTRRAGGRIKSEKEREVSSRTKAAIGDEWVDEIDGNIWQRLATENLDSTVQSCGLRWPTPEPSVCACLEQTLRRVSSFESMGF